MNMKKYMYERLTTISSLLCLLHICASEIISEYILRQDNFHDRLVSRYLLFSTTAENKMTCAIDCMSDFRCVCFTFRKADGQCRLLGVSHSDPDSAPIATGTKLFYLSRALGYIGYPCTLDSDCKDTLSVCNAGVCTCQIGYSFSVNEGCVLTCPTYGSDFTAYIERGLRDNNDFRDWGYSEKQCLDLCLAETGYTCLTVERYPADGFCTLTRTTWFGVAVIDRDLNAVGYVLYHRNCAI